MKARAAQEMPAHVEVAQMLARYAMALEEAAQAAETAGTETSSQTGRDVPAAKEEKLVVGGVSANAVATATDEREKSSLEGHLSSRDSGREGAPSRPTDRHEAASAVLGGTAVEVVARCGRY